MSHVPEPCYISFSLLYSFFPLTACHMFPNLEQECDQLDEWTTVVRKKRWCHKSGNSLDAKFRTVQIFVSRLKPDTRIVSLKKMVWDKLQNARSVRFQALRTRYDTYACFKISAKRVDKGDIIKVTCLTAGSGCKNLYWNVTNIH